MATKVVMEALSPTMEEGRIASWLKSEGDTVKKGETLAEVETDKAIMELVARGDGVLRKIIVEADVAVDVGTLVGVIGEADEDISSIAGGSDGEPSAADDSEPEDEEKKATDSKEPSEATTETPTPVAAPSSDKGRIKASPLARRIASERGIDLSHVQGSGPAGRIIKRDVESFEPSAGAQPTAPVGGYEDVPLSQMRKTIATRLAQSIGPVPTFYLTTRIQMDRMWDARKALNESGETKISFNDIILKATANALVQHRECNAWWGGDHIRYFNEVHLSVAVAIDEGLITPVIRNAHTKSLRQIAAETKDLVERARNRKLKPDEYTGGTFSVSNLGMFGIEHFTAIINPPEAGILAIGEISEETIAEGVELNTRKIMKMTMSCDHRVIDGATGARFLQTLKGMLENPLALVY